MTTVSLAPRGLAAGRFIKALAVAKGDVMGAAAYAAGQWGNWRDTSHIELELKTAVGAMTGDGDLVAPSSIAADLIELARPRSLIDRIPGFRIVPLNTWVIRFSGDVYASTVAEGAPKPVSKFAFDRVQLDPIKVTAMTVSTDELVRHADPSAELGLGRELGRALGTKGDLAFIDPDRAGSIRTAPPLSVRPEVRSLKSTRTSAACLPTSPRRTHSWIRQCSR